MNKPALLLINRHSRKGHQEESRVVSELRNLGLDILPITPTRGQSLSDLIRRYHDQVDRVIIGGGDGTLNAAITGLVETGLPLGILPLGTANDLARTLKIPMTLPAACQVAATGSVRKIDLGWVNGHYFFNVASLGLSVQITRQLDRGLKRRWGVIAYAFTAFQVLWQSRPFSAEIHCQDQSLRSKTIQIAVGNGRYYGGGMAVAEDATIDDQRLDLYSLEIQHWWQMLALIPDMRRGTHIHWSNVRSLQGKEFRVVTTSPHWINTDGELTTQTPGHFRLIPQALSVLTPR
ncbi:MAG: lipid kinase [Leptolyngbyaceae cyanobacterium bins.59]|nr:lipid kinase [Leptolyngbyaceae cyanobacterium bins.59]